ncbi:hypothetical protein SteCoe_21318 [Stentor coeruleus]|uniref:LITAF domain-containing protein n=1 Tax=Stentor coeruleus TaxID=5963 RepID=A0A1R2BPV3_9CILI|nr:hypothetical protein SteCoe_21318 [Stentor coeruleus]
MQAKQTVSLQQPLRSSNTDLSSIANSGISNHQGLNSPITKLTFRFTEVVGNFEVHEDSKPFKKLKFENTGELKTLDINSKDMELSEVISSFSFSYEEPKEKENSKIPNIHTFDQKVRNPDNKLSPRSKRSEKYSTIYTLSSDSSKLPDDIFEIEKPGTGKIAQHLEDRDREREKENIPSRSKEYLEFLPAKKFCKKCNTEVNTTIRMEMPTIPFWKRICCANCEIDALERFQRILHVCVHCKKVIHIVTPSLY